MEEDKLFYVKEAIHLRKDFLSKIPKVEMKKEKMKRLTALRNLKKPTHTHIQKFSMGKIITNVKNGN